MLCLNRYIPSDIFWIGLSTHILFTISIQRYCYRKYQGYFAKIINIERKKSYCWPLCFNGTVTRVCQWLSETLPIWDTFKRVPGSEPYVDNPNFAQSHLRQTARTLFLCLSNVFTWKSFEFYTMMIITAVVDFYLHFEASFDCRGGI